MTDATAWIVASPESAAFGSNHLSPTHLLVLSENDRAAWELQTIGQGSPQKLVTWIPQSASTFVYDAMLMLAVHVFEDEQILEAASRSIPDVGANRLDLTMPDRSTELMALYELCQADELVVPDGRDDPLPLLVVRRRLCPYQEPPTRSGGDA